MITSIDGNGVGHRLIHSVYGRTLSLPENPRLLQDYIRNVSTVQDYDQLSPSCHAVFIGAQNSFTKFRSYYQSKCLAITNHEKWPAYRVGYRDCTLFLT